jgi:hypothetical protein
VRPQFYEMSTANPASSIVPTAAAILREEMQSLAGGASAPADVRGAGRVPNEIPAQALRDQARVLADAFLRLLEQRPGQFEKLFAQAPPGMESGTRDTVLVLRAARPVSAGGVANVSLRLANDAADPDDCTLHVTDLIGPSGHRIPAAHVRISPRTLRIQEGSSVDVLIEIRVPSSATSGGYTGLLQADDGEGLRALIQLAVT